MPKVAKQTFPFRLKTASTFYPSLENGKVYTQFSTPRSYFPVQKVFSTKGQGGFNMKRRDSHNSVNPFESMPDWIFFSLLVLMMEKNNNEQQTPPYYEFPYLDSWIAAKKCKRSASALGEICSLVENKTASLCVQFDATMHVQWMSF